MQNFLINTEQAELLTKLGTRDLWSKEVSSSEIYTNNVSNVLGPSWLSHK